MADKITRALAYLDRLPVAVSGGGGHNATLRAACECFRFGLTRAEADEAMGWYNDNRCQPKWKAHDLAHKIADAERITSGGGQVGKHLGQQRAYSRRPSAVFVAPPLPARRVVVKPAPVLPVWEVSAADEEARWAHVADGLGLALAEFDARCGVEAWEPAAP